MCHKIGLKTKVDEELVKIGSTKRYAEGQIPSEHLAEAAELTTNGAGRSVYCHDHSAVTPEERGAVKKAFQTYFATQQEAAIA